jgi:hypothetical protein
MTKAGSEEEEASALSKFHFKEISILIGPGRQSQESSRMPQGQAYFQYPNWLCFGYATLVVENVIIHSVVEGPILLGTLTCTC